MWTGDKNFYDLLTMAVGDRTQLQAFIEAGKEKYNKLELFGFPFRPDMQADFSFEQIEKEYGINAMATWVDLDSDGTPISEDGVALSTGKIPRMKKRADFDEQQYRKRLIARAVGGDATFSARTALYDSVKKLIDAHTNSLTYMRHQMVSNGKFELTEINNNGGIKGVIYTASIPTDNQVTKTTTGRWFTTGLTEGTASDPIADLIAVGEMAKGSAYHWEVDAETLRKALRHSKMVQSLGFASNPVNVDPAVATSIGNNMTYDSKLALLQSKIGHRIVAIDSVSRIDKFDKLAKKVVGQEVRSFEPDSWALVPDGNIGETLAVLPIRMGMPSEASAYADYYGGRLLMTYDYDVHRKTQFIGTEMTALVVPDKPKYMFILKTA